MTPNYTQPTENRHLQFYNLLSSQENFGILSSKKIPMLPSFPIFMNVGSLQINLKANIVVEALSYDEIEHLKNFHTIIFQEKMLSLMKDFMVFDIANEANCYLVVPGKYKLITK